MTEAAICLANEMAGVAERLREDSLAYSKLRVHFGRQIASFQSMKHKAADMVGDVELAKAAPYRAAAARYEGHNDLGAAAALGRGQASEACRPTAIHAMQIHAGMGF